MRRPNTEEGLCRGTTPRRASAEAQHRGGLLQRHNIEEALCRGTIPRRACAEEQHQGGLMWRHNTKDGLCGGRTLRSACARDFLSVQLIRFIACARQLRICTDNFTFSTVDPSHELDRSPPINNSPLTPIADVHCGKKIINNESTVAADYTMIMNG